jgi:enamine deaminase RidA (YjgF/YER057c/UK114 family)
MIARNPTTVHQPVAAYTHQIEVTDGGRWLVLSGQLGLQPDGTVPDDPIEQIEVALANVGRNLAAADMNVRDIVKLTIYLVGNIDTGRRRTLFDGWLDGHRPCMTLLYVTALAAPAYNVEIDAWAHAASRSA